MNSFEIHTAEKVERTYRKFDVDEIRKDFPILHRLVNDKPLIYIDNAATTQKPNVVIVSKLIWIVRVLFKLTF